MTEETSASPRGPTRILVAIDGSAPSEVAVGLVAAQPWPPGTAIRVVEAIDLGPGIIGGPWPTFGLAQSDELETSVRAEARYEVEDARARLAARGWDATAVVETGRPATVIIEEAGAMAADLVVIGSRGHGTIASMLLGSVSSEVIDHAPAPVLLARSHRIERVVVAWDGSATAALAVEAVRDWPVLANAEIRVVTVADIGMPWWTGFAEVGAPVGAQETEVVLENAEASRRAATRLADDLVATLRSAGRTAVADPRQGDAATALIAAARETSADLIVMGTHGRTGLARLRLGSVASNVTRHAPCSVLVIRAPQTTEAARST